MSDVKSSKPIIKDWIVDDPTLSTKFNVESSYFEQWLEKQSKIKVIFTKEKSKSYSLYKDNKGYWTAQKRTQGKLRAKRLGDSCQLAIIARTGLRKVGDNLVGDNPTKDGEIERLKQEIVELEQKMLDMVERIKELEDNQTQDRRSLTQSNLPIDCQLAILNELEQGLKIKANKGGGIKKHIRTAISMIKGESKEILTNKEE